MKQHISHHLSRLSKHLLLWHETQRDNSVLEIAKNRSIIAACVFVIAFAFVSIRLFDVMLLRPFTQKGPIHFSQTSSSPKLRAEIVDRNGEILATQIYTGSIYANPKEIINAEEAAFELSRVMPDLDYKSLLKKLKSGKGFVWIRRHVPPSVQNAVHYLGLPGIYLQPDQKRVYPFGNLVSHVVGTADIDNLGLSGIEKYFDAPLTSQVTPLQMSIDVRIQHILRDELAKAISHFKCIGGVAMFVDAKTGEALGMVSLPDFNPNLPNSNDLNATFNKATLGVYEPGSTFKVLNVAIGLETSKITLKSIVDARYTIHVGGHSINDFRGLHRLMSVEEVVIYSSNIGAAKIAQEFGIKTQKEFLNHFKALQTPKIELPELGTPLIPKHWGESTLYTVSFGHGIAVPPLQAFATLTGIANHGLYQDFTLLKQNEKLVKIRQSRLQKIISAKTSSDLRQLMRKTVTEGFAKRANVPGLDVFGKTGTAEKVVGRGYSKENRFTFFVGGFPMEDPQFMIYVGLDGPKPVEGTYGFATGGWNAAPTVKKMLCRIAPILGYVVDPTAVENEGRQTNLMPVNQSIEVSDETE